MISFFNRKHRFEFFVIIGIITIISALNIAYPLIIKNLLDASISADMPALFSNIKILVIATVVVLIFEMFHKLVRADYINEIALYLRGNICSGILNMSFKQFNEKNSASYISILNNNVDMVTSDYYDKLVDVFQSVATIGFGVVALISLDFKLAILVILTNVLPLFTPTLFKNRLKESRNRITQSLEFLNLKIDDFLRGFSIIKTNKIEGEMASRFNDSSKTLNDKMFCYQKLQATIDMIVGLLSFGGYILLIVVGTVLIFNRKLSPGALLAAIQISDLLTGPINMVAYQWNSINSVKDVKSEIEDLMTVNATNGYSDSLLNVIDSIKVSNLNFSYEDKPILRDINLEFEANKKYLLIGASGSGKSTLLKLLGKLSDDYTGEISVNSVDLRDISSENFYSLVNTVFQDAVIFNDTIRNNVTLYRDYSQTEIEDVIVKANLKELLPSIHNLSEHFVNGGVNFSGGERQRIALARALINKPRVIFMDEATSALDVENTMLIEKSILDDPSILLLNISHKLNKELLKKYDEIIILKDGCVFQKGGFSQLYYEGSHLYTLLEMNE
ncbi:MAG: ABC transporter ATP-binding protein [Cellulosilyticaceae bacterium]